MTQQLRGFLLNFDWFIKLSVQTFQPLIVIYRRRDFVYILEIHIIFSAIVLSFMNPELILFFKLVAQSLAFKNNYLKEWGNLYRVVHKLSLHQNSIKLALDQL